MVILPQALYPNNSEVRVRGAGRSEGVRQAPAVLLCKTIRGGATNEGEEQASDDNKFIIGKHCFSFLNGEIEAPFKKR